MCHSFSAIQVKGMLEISQLDLCVGSLKSFSSHGRGYFSDLKCWFSKYFFFTVGVVTMCVIVLLLGVNQCDTVQGNQLNVWNKCCCEVGRRCTLHYLNAEILSWLNKVKDIRLFIYIYIYILFVCLFVYVQIVMQRYKDRSLHTRKMHCSNRSVFHRVLFTICSNSFGPIWHKTMFFWTGNAQFL